MLVGLHGPHARFFPPFPSHNDDDDKGEGEGGGNGNGGWVSLDLDTGALHGEQLGWGLGLKCFMCLCAFDCPLWRGGVCGKHVSVSTPQKMQCNPTSHTH